MSFRLHRPVWPYRPRALSFSLMCCWFYCRMAHRRQSHQKRKEIEPGALSDYTHWSGCCPLMLWTASRWRMVRRARPRPRPVSLLLLLWLLLQLFLTLLILLFLLILLI